MKIMRYLWVVSVLIFHVPNALANSDFSDEEAADAQSPHPFVVVLLEDELTTETSPLLQSTNPSFATRVRDWGAQFNTPTGRYMAGLVSINGIILGSGALASHLIQDWGCMLVAGLVDIFANTAYCHCC